MAQAPRTGVLLVNLGTPDAAEVPAVRAYLREFLMDGRVIDLPVLPRWALVNLVIAPFRAPKSTHAYQSVWTPEGSPLLVHGRALASALADRLGLPVALGMRYGNPSLTAALASLADVDRIVAVPLYPQYASATTGSTLEALGRVVATGPAIPAVEVRRPLAQYPAALDAMAAAARPALDAFGPDAVLFSYHGLPERHLTAARAACRPTETAGSAGGCCDRPDALYGYCYRAQCLATTRELARRLGIDAPHSAFQSRLGRDPWIRPYTDDVLVQLAASGVRRLAVLTPSFVADCLETLEEIGDRGAATFRAAGGQELLAVPCPNADPAWVEALAGIVLDG